MSRKAKRVQEKTKKKVLYKLIVVAILVWLAFLILKYVPNYVNTEISDKTNLVINNSNVTADLKKDIIIENGVIYVAMEDVKNFFDPHIYYDEKYNQIITTSENQVTSMVVGENTMVNNGTSIETSGTIIQQGDTYYIPFSSLKDTYNVEISYIEATNTITVDSKDRRYVLAYSTKDNKVKAYPTAFARTVDTIEEAEKVTVVQNDNGKNNVVDGWIEIRTDTGKIGYVKEKTVTNELVVRETIEKKKQIEGNISMVWDYYSEYYSAPDRSGEDIQGVNVVSPTFFTLVDEGKGKIYDNAGDAGKQYINWAHSSGYLVWPSVSNNSYIETTAEIMRDYKLRQDLIENIVSLVVQYNLDGINIDFEYMHDEDKDLFSRFIIELKPRLNELGVVLSVDVTAPDGSEEWSLCFDRNLIGEVADYIVFMAYDQYGTSSTKPGTNAGYDWVKANIEKFIGQEAVKPEKIILGIPFYTRLWEENSGNLECYTVDMEDIEEVIPENVTRTWDDNLKQYYVEFVEDGITNKMWIEDAESIKAKLSLVSEYKLAGAAYWTKDREPDSIWPVISEALGVE